MPRLKTTLCRILGYSVDEIPATSVLTRTNSFRGGFNRVFVAQKCQLTSSVAVGGAADHAFLCAYNDKAGPRAQARSRLSSKKKNRKRIWGRAKWAGLQTRPINAGREATVIHVGVHKRAQHVLQQ